MSDPKAFIHNPKGDDRVPLPSHLEYLANQGVTAHKYGSHVFLKGGHYNTNILDEILRRKNNQQSIAITVNGEPGSGKTYFGVTLAQIIDPMFNCTDLPELPPREDTGQIVFSREHLTHLVSSESPLKRGQVVLLDEVHFSLGARDWQNRDQKTLVNLLSAIRSRGYILILIVLHNSMIDRIIRDFVVNLSCHMETRGTAKVYRRWFPHFSDKPHSKRLGKLTLPLPDHHRCNYITCLSCRYLNKPEGHRCLTIRAIYERRKSDFLDQASERASIEAPVRKKTNTEVVALLHEARDLMRLNKHRQIDVSSIIKILDIHKLPSGKNTAYTFKGLYEDAYPDTTQYLIDRSH